jgi:hypothetical protein
MIKTLKFNSFDLLALLAITVGLFLSTPLNAEIIWPSEADRIAAYRERCQQTIDYYVGTTKPEDPANGSLWTIAANISDGKNIEWARTRLRTVNEAPSGGVFWMHPMVLTMYAGKDVWNEEDWDVIKELWRTYYPYRGDTENHWLMYYASIYLACQMFPDSGPEAWYNGKSAKDNMEEAEDYIRDWIKVTTSYGQGEYDSPNYIEEYLRPLGLLAGWAEDPELKELSRMMMDYVIMDFSVENLDGLYGGAHSRLYPRYALRPALAAATRHAWLLFGQGIAQYNAGNIILALCDYTPPAILHKIAIDRDEAYVQQELKRTRWRLRNAGPEAFEIDGRITTPVYKYTYVHPDYMLGSSQGGLLQPIQQQTWSLLWKDENATEKTNTMFGLQPYSNPLEGTMYFVNDWDTVTDLIARSKVDYDSPDKMEGGSPYEQVFQYKSTLIALYSIPEDTRFPHILTLFSRELENRVEDPSGWIFAKGGPVYVAYRPFAPGEWKSIDWTGLLKGGAGGFFSTNFAEFAEGSEFYFSESLNNGYIVQIAPVSEYSSMKAFIDDINQLPLEFSMEPNPSVTFTGLDGATLSATYGEAPAVDGEVVNYQDWKLFDGPFSQAEKASESVEIIYGNETYSLDFKNGTSSTTLSSN